MADFDYNFYMKPLEFSEVIQKLPEKTDKAGFVAQYPLNNGKGWGSITTKFLIDKKDFIKNNPQLKKYFDNPKLSIPAGTKFNVPGHRAKKGDTAYSIANKYGMTVKEFLELNKIDNKTAKIMNGQVYYVYAKPSEEFRKKITKSLEKPLDVKPPIAIKDEPKVEFSSSAKKEIKVPYKAPIIPINLDKTTLASISNKYDVCKATDISSDFIDKLTEFEGKKRELSADAIQRPVIGIGHDLSCRPKSELKKYKAMKAKGRKLSDKEIYQLLAKDIVEAQNGLIKIFGENYFKLTQKQKEALIDLAFNIGNGALAKSKNLIKYVNEACNQKTKNPKKSAAYFYKAAMEFDHRSAGGQIQAGLCKRRINNIIIFTGQKPSQMPQKVLRKLYENYTKGIYASKNKTEFFRTTNELMGCKLVKNSKGNIEVIPIQKPTLLVANNQQKATDVRLKTT